MYIQIQELKERGFSKRGTAKALGISRDSVASYWDMKPDEYIEKAENIRKQSSLEKYEPVILGWLYQYPSMTSAQIYDWLLEHYNPDISERGVRRYVAVLRETHGIDKKSKPREYAPVDELPMGHQMQVDFGEKSLKTPNGRYEKVYFIGAVLSHSRYKWGYFLDRPFRTTDLIMCLNMCFEHLGGATRELVFDQDSIVSVSENYGDIIYTYEFEKYRQRTGLNIYLCRKSDPESKGKVESVVKYIKNNFLPNRIYLGLDILNQAFEKWLARTGNGKMHGTTKRIPSEVFEQERDHLRPIFFSEEPVRDDMYRKIRKDNTVLFESNRYTLPIGTYTKEKEVRIEISDGKLLVWQAFGDYIIAEHTIAAGKGQLIKNNNHRRDTGKTIDEMYSMLSNMLDSLCDEFLLELRKRYPRYVRDQYGLVLSLTEKKGVSAVIRATEYCRKHGLFAATDLRDALEYLEMKNEAPVSERHGIIAPVTNPAAVAVVTQKRSIDEYIGIGGDLL